MRNEIGLNSGGEMLECKNINHLIAEQIRETKNIDVLGIKIADLTSFILNVSEAEELHKQISWPSIKSRLFH
jgi:hypothetical protein